jgi:hypothetical protein
MMRITTPADRSPAELRVVAADLHAADHPDADREPFVSCTPNS